MKKNFFQSYNCNLKQFMLFYKDKNSQRENEKNIERLELMKE